MRWFEGERMEMGHAVAERVEWSGKEGGGGGGCVTTSRFVEDELCLDLWSERKRDEDVYKNSQIIFRAFILRVLQMPRLELQ